jgi:multidrug efflux pump subunit AcrB
VIRFLILLLLAASGEVLLAQTAPTSTTPTPDAPARMWRCELPGGTYEVAIRSIVSVSTHEYVVDGTARVTELNIDTQGNMAVRFYYIEPLTPKSPLGVGQSALDKVSDLTKEVAERTGQDEIWKRVVKNYPTTTHSHTIEYRLDSQDELKKAFTSVQTAFETGRGSTFKP